ncbi:MAG: hypothetical protein A2068_02660 [Ignavibacteria bacterium GWB2_35_6b]|nr:MAG: hypothetical protein A2068_02660 [Ignavibacteria bacterium GWB2_35_6b]
MNQIHFHRRNLPHIYIPERTYFITFRLKGSLPQNIINKLRSNADRLSALQSVRYKEEKRFFKNYDDYLNKAQHGPTYLKNKEIAQIVFDAIKYRDNKEYKVICFCIMPNHVHLMFMQLENSKTISQIMQSLKWYTAREASKILNRSGSFWQAESYDHIVRDEDEYYRIIKYILNNPVKAGLVEKWDDWEFNYCNADW